MHIYIYLSLTSAGLRSALLRFIGSMVNLSLLTTGDYYYHKSQNNMVERKWWLGRDVVWVLVGVTCCVPRPWGKAWLHCFLCLCRLRTVHCMNPSQVIYLLSWAHTCLWEWEGLLLSCHGFWLFSDQLIRGGDRWRSKHHIETGPQVWGLESKFGRGPRTLDKSGTGWFHLCLGCKRGVYFLGYPAEHIDSWIAVSMWRYYLTML
jgi:hypothetical protein